jgi:16S rRNA (adenine1518-N6/adenine1519-N6)-dimethyltransferase
VATELTKPRLVPRKSLGQNFLVDRRVQEKIAATLELKKSDAVLEIGTGRGELTRLLAAQAGAVYAVEIDRRLVAHLRSVAHEQPNIQIIAGDILTLNLQKTIGDTVVKVAGNIPYHLTSPIIDWLIAEQPQIELAVLLLQREVARRITGKPETKDWGPLAIAVTCHFHAKKLFDVKPGSFYPPPRVMSSLVLLFPRSEPKVSARNEEKLLKIVRRAFAHRRKTAINSLILSGGYSAEELVPAFREVNLSPKARGEEITFDQFVRLTEALQKLR